MTTYGTGPCRRRLSRYERVGRPLPGPAPAGARRPRNRDRSAPRRLCRLAWAGFVSADVTVLTRDVTGRRGAGLHATGPVRPLWWPGGPRGGTRHLPRGHGGAHPSVWGQVRTFGTHTCRALRTRRGAGPGPVAQVPPDQPAAEPGVPRRLLLRADCGISHSLVPRRLCPTRGGRPRPCAAGHHSAPIWVPLTGSVHTVPVCPQWKKSPAPHIHELVD